MKESVCEEFLLAKMAELDGEATDVSTDEHIAQCENCRLEAARMRTLNEMFDRQTRLEHDIAMWQAVKARISSPPERAGWRTFAVLATCLAAFKVVSLSLQNDPGWLLGLLPLVFAAALFILLRENPFKVNTELILESNNG